MQRNAQNSKCEFKPCSAESCNLPWHRCTQTKSLDFYICAPIPVCTTNACCKETEICIQNHCVDVCTSGKCVNEQMKCSDNICQIYPPCKVKKGFHLCDNGKICDHGKGCIDIECYKDEHCKVGNCVLGKCEDILYICETDFDCLPGRYCEETFAGYKLCTRTPPCPRCPIGTRCSKNGRMCIPLIPPILDEDCPSPMQAIFDKFLGIKICELIKCKDDKDCKKGLKCNLKKSICEVKIIYIGCRNDKECTTVDQKSKCVLGTCMTTPSCKAGMCPPTCLDTQGCPPGLSCYNNSCSNPCPECRPPKITDCSEANLFQCRYPYVCLNKKCVPPSICVSTDHCPCFGEGGNCPPTCDNSALVCSKLGMICSGRKCVYPICTRDAQCPGQFCMNGQCVPPKECTTSSENCACFENVCLNEITLCPNCPNGYECYEGSFCASIGIKCLTKYHCPEHMQCENGFCKTFQCQTNKCCSFGRRCASNGHISICVPEIPPQKPPVCTKSSSCPLGTKCNTTCVFINPPVKPCPDGSYNYEGECSEPCKKKECKQGFKCIDNVCQRVPGDKDCSDHSRLNPKYGCHVDIWCFDDRYCPVPTFCDIPENQCVNFCDKKRPCPEGFHCNETVCRIDTYTQCDYYGRCPPGKVCNRILNKCEPSCFLDSDCKKKQKCVDMTCIDITEDGCKNCSALQYCKNKVCINIQCLKHSDCQPWERCKMGICIKILICETDRNCPSDQFCSNGVCITNPKCEPDKCPEGSKCVPNGDISICVYEVKCIDKCYVGAECEKNICIPRCNKKTCKINEYCQDGKCVPPNICVTKADCPKNYMCTNKICTWEGCKSIRDCPPKYICENSICVYKECLSDDDCQANEFCKLFVCEVKRCYTNADCLIPSSVCSNGFCSRCPGNQILKNGRCEQPPGCKADEDCPVPMICNRNRCTFCMEDTDCKTPKVCKKLGYSGVAVCKEITNLVPTCTTAFDCDSGQICVNKKCSPLCDCYRKNKRDVCDGQRTCQMLDGGFCACVETCEASCVGPGKRCVNNICISPGCIKDYQCPPNFFCTDGVCRPPPRKCNCDSSETCVEGVCIREPPCKNKNCTSGFKCQQVNKDNALCLPIINYCINDYDCPELMKCEGRVCKFRGCRTDAQCSPLRRCRNKICIPRHICNVDKDCDEKEKCMYGTCHSPCEDKCENGLECIQGICKA